MLLDYAVTFYPYLRCHMYEDLDFRNASLSGKDVAGIAAVLVALGTVIHFGGMVAVAGIAGLTIGYVCAKIF